MPIIGQSQRGMLSSLAGLAIVFLFLHSALSAQTDKHKLPRLPGAALLVGYPPSYLVVTTADRTHSIVDKEFEWTGNCPTLSGDGLNVTSVRNEPRSVPVATYSILEKKWTEYEGVKNFQSCIALTSDGSRLAFTVQESSHSPTASVHVIDLKTGSKKVIPAGGHRGGTRLSWSPDGRRIAYEMYQSTPEEAKRAGYRQAIFVLDLETGKSTKIADGEAPSWSPSGEWIAYLDHSTNWEPDAGSSEPNRWHQPPNPNRVSIIRPDGTGSTILVTLGKDRFLGILFPLDRTFYSAPVWSPDSKTILLNEWGDWERGLMNIHLLDLATMKMKRKFKGTPPIFGWAEAK